MEESRSVELTKSELRYILCGVCNDIEWNELEDYQIEKLWVVHNKITRAMNCIENKEKGYPQKSLEDYHWRDEKCE